MNGTRGNVLGMNMFGSSALVLRGWGWQLGASNLVSGLAAKTCVDLLVATHLHDHACWGLCISIIRIRSVRRYGRGPGARQHLAASCRTRSYIPQLP